MSTGIPPQAITDSTEAVARELRKMPGKRDERSEENIRRLAFDLATAALDAIAPFLAEDGWDAARDRATETNEARRGERERVVQLIHLIRVLHKPVKGSPWLTCHGCDLGPHPEDYPDWPCSTAELVFTPEEIKEATDAA